MTRHILELEPCRTGPSFIARPEKGGLHIDLAKVCSRMEARGFTQVADAGVMMVMRREFDVTLYRTGTILLRTDMPHEAGRIIDELEAIIREVE